MRECALEPERRPDRQKLISKAQIRLRLNEEQQKAVDQVDGPVLILAGAGTGKTRVITARIAHMVRQGISPAKILAVTFTNKAANEMRERVAKAIHKDDAQEITICTFHSLCVRILRQSIERLGYKRNFSIYAGSDQLGLVRRLVVKKSARDEKLDPKLALTLISRAKNRAIPVSDTDDALIAEVYRAYQAELKTLNAVDFDDLLILAVRALKEHAGVREEWRRRFSHIMVDEFQDTNRLQMDLVRLMVGPEKNICVVGDDDQSIYGWRGAEISNILEFERHFPNPLIIKLEQNYRSTNPILHTANSLIRHNVERREKRLWSANPGEEPVRVVAMPEEESEAAHVIAEILENRSTEGLPWDQFAILFRMNSQSRLFEEQLRRHEIPYRLIGGQSFYDRREVKDLVAYLQLFVNPADDVSLLRIIGTPPRGIGGGTITLATDHSVSSGLHLFQALQDPAFVAQLSKRAAVAVGDFTRLINESHRQVTDSTSGYAALLQKVVEETGYIEFVKRNCKTPDEAVSREQNVREMMDALYQHESRSSAGLRGFLDEIALMQEKEEEEDGKDDLQGGVLLITLHAAKGLEFPRVFLVGLEEGILPHSRSVDEGSRDEERRLFYVGITRAMSHLTLSYCLSRKRWGDVLPCRPSSFLEELDEAHLEELDYEELCRQPATEDLAQDYFARMKGMLEGVEGFELKDEG